MQDFRQVKVWQKAHELVLVVYRVTRSFPPDERFGLTAQLRRSAASVPANVAEGCGRGTDQDFRRFVQMAMGSASETEYHVLLANDLGLLDEDDFRDLIRKVQEVKRMASSLIQRLGETTRQTKPTTKASTLQ